jgi:hypothetical protein
MKGGYATWYGRGTHKDGTKFTGDMYSCASNYFPRYALLLVTNKLNGRKVLVWNNDVHEADGIIIDLSRKAFGKISKLRLGKIPVEVVQICVTKEPNELREGAMRIRLLTIRLPEFFRDFFNRWIIAGIEIMTVEGINNESSLFAVGVYEAEFYWDILYFNYFYGKFQEWRER